MGKNLVWEIQGDTWAIIFILSKHPSPSLQAHVFVEAKDRRPRVRAPWPVSSVALGEDEPVRLAHAVL